MEELIQQLKVVQATAFSLYLKAHNFHWNVTGPFFAQYHEFFGDYYQEVYESVDGFAEHNRTLDTFVPGSLSRFAELTKIGDETTVSSAQDMFKKLYAANEIMCIELKKCRDLADEAGKDGIVNYLEGRQDYHDKMHWMIRAHIVNNSPVEA